MTAVNSTMLDLGTKAPPFRLPSATGGIFSLDNFSSAKGLLVMFICNHCPYVKHIRGVLVDLVKEYQIKGIEVVAINANDWDAYPDDCPDAMTEEVRQQGYTFPYLYDETQEVAKAYRAACTPDFFIFNPDRKLIYRGQMDDSRPGNKIPVTGNDLKAAMDGLLEGRDIAEESQKPSMGCNIKWRPGNEPEYY